MRLQQSSQHDRFRRQAHPASHSGHEQVTVVALLIAVLSLALVCSAAAIQHV